MGTEESGRGGWDQPRRVLGLEKCETHEQARHSLTHSRLRKREDGGRCLVLVEDPLQGRELAGQELEPRVFFILMTFHFSVSLGLLQLKFIDF